MDKGMSDETVCEIEDFGRHTESGRTADAKG